MNKKRVLIGYASYNSGHKTSAQYLYNYFKEQNKYDVKIIDLTDYANFIGKLGTKLFDYSVKSNLVFSFFYGISDNKISALGNEKLWKKSFDNQTLRNEITNFKPDIIIGTHFYVSYMAEYYNKISLINSKIITVLTDFKEHKWWSINKNKIDYFIVANELVKQELIAREKIDSKKVLPYGIPVNYEYTKNLETKDDIKRKYSLVNDKPIFLFFAGGSLGYNYTYDYFVELIKSNLDINIIFICGNNKKLQAKCDTFILKHDVKNALVLGFSKDIFNLMNISDIVITKPGGLTVNECLVMKKPCILVPGLGGQEHFNAKFMTKHHYALKCKTPKGLVKRTKKILYKPFLLKSMNYALNKLEKNNSCEKIYNLVDKIK